MLVGGKVGLSVGDGVGTSVGNAVRVVGAKVAVGRGDVMFVGLEVVLEDGRIVGNAEG